MQQNKTNYIRAYKSSHQKKREETKPNIAVVARTLAMLPDPAIPRAMIRFHNGDGSLGTSEVLLAADVVFD